MSAGNVYEDQKEIYKTLMKRQGNLYEKMISDENILEAINEVNKTHRWRKGHHPNRVVQWVESDIPARIQELRQIIEDGFIQSEITPKRIYDQTSEKYRDIYEPKLWPEQYVHHILIQVIKKPIMRKMDKWACGSIPKRGIHYGVKGLKKWMKNDKATRYCAELDIRHFYPNIRPELVVDSLKRIIKDRRVIDLAERIIQQGILIGFYTSQWFANLVLQDLDELIRCNSTRYIRYMDNMTIFHSNKRKLRKLLKMIKAWLESKYLSIKDNWQVFRTACRTPQALGYRYNKDYIILRKKNLLRLKRQLSRIYRRIRRIGKATYKQACGFISRVGQLKWCDSVQIKRIIEPGLIAKLKNVVRTQQRKDRMQWNMY